MRTLSLPDSLTTSLASGHPWVYRDHVGRFSAKSGDWVAVQAGSWKGFGLWDADSPIALRIFSTKQVPDAGWIDERVREAYDLRARVREQGVTGYRLIYGEADQLPGVVVDVYAGHAIVVTYSRSLGALVPLIAASVSALPGIVSVTRRQKRDDGVSLSPLAGEAPPRHVTIEEFGMRLIADLHHGQKTGLFFDHRDNRHFVRSQARGRTVLNLFSYSGGFSVAAALGGASAVTSVDIAAPAIADCEENFRASGLADFPHRGEATDVFRFLEQAAKKSERYDVVVCDPPSFAKNRQQLKAAEKAYRRVMAAGLAVTNPGGLFCAASCTSQVSPAAFRRAIADAARKARVRFQVVRDIGHAPDHPVLIGHEEGRYLKFVAGRVLPRC